MNTDPNATTILCFGDSNTWGQTPDISGRHPADVRWPGKLQATLGSDYYVIEEGLSSRTTDLDYAKKPGRNGKQYLIPCLESHNPLDIVIIMLGTNDLKIEFDRSPIDIAQAIEELINDIKRLAWNKSSTPPKIVIISPIQIDITAPDFAKRYTGYYDHESALKSDDLAKAIEPIATANDCLFLDASTVAKPGDDGIHMDAASHGTLGELVANAIRKL